MFTLIFVYSNSWKDCFSLLLLFICFSSPCTNAVLSILSLWDSFFSSLYHCRWNVIYTDTPGAAPVTAAADTSSVGFRDVKTLWSHWDESYLSVVLICGFTCFCCVLAVMLGAPLLQPTAFPWWAGAEERCRVGQTGPDRWQRDACQGGSRHRTADAGQQPGTRSVEEYEWYFTVFRR